jgi:hypothetical protein
MRRKAKRSVICDDQTWELARQTADKLSETEGVYVSISKVVRMGIVLVARVLDKTTTGGE